VATHAVSTIEAVEPAPSAPQEILRAPWDVLVIGAGPAGSVAAHVLAAAGRTVLLVDRSAMPRPKVCGCCLGPAGVETLQHLGLARALSGASVVRECSVRVKRAIARLATPHYRVLSREVLDTRLLAAATDAGVTPLMGWNARVAKDGSVLLQHSSGDAQRSTVRPRQIVVADGLAGTSLHDRPEFAWRVTTGSRMGVGATLARSPVPLDDEEIAMLCGHTGYLGLVRLPTGEIDAAAALDPKAVQEAGGPGPLCEHIVSRCGGDATAIHDARWRGTPLLTRRRSRVEAGNIVVLGDAAGYVEPFTGEGMTWAIEGAAVAARLVADRLEGQQREGHWTTCHQQLTQRAHTRCRWVARALRHEALLHMAAMFVERCPGAGRLLARHLGPPVNYATRGANEVTA
jgi:menaquinone-9 beta-reductase